MSFFATSKLTWFFVEPSHLLLWMLIGGAILSLLRYRIGRALTGACAFVCFVLLLWPVGNWALQPLEDGFAKSPPPSHVDGILELGSGLNGDILRSRGEPGMENDQGGLITLYALAQRYPQARIIYSGGSGELGRGSTPEARVAEQVLRNTGLDQRRVTYEAKSRNTWENIAYSKRLAKPKPGEIWLVVTSASRMPRAMAVAQRLGWKMTPWPSNYLTSEPGPQSHLSFSANLSHLDLAVHEWVGLIAYRAHNMAT